MIRRDVVIYFFAVALLSILVGVCWVLGTQGEKPAYLTVRIDGSNYETRLGVTTIFFSSGNMITVWGKYDYFGIGEVYQIQYYTPMWDWSGFKTVLGVALVVFK